jgi:Immunoglobulin I-set domain
LLFFFVFFSTNAIKRSQLPISAGETATFNFQLDDKPVNVTWMKDNKPLEDPLQDRLKFVEGANNSYLLELTHCRESDSGTYTARATNGFENATCTAQLIVEKCK